MGNVRSTRGNSWGLDRVKTTNVGEMPARLGGGGTSRGKVGGN